MLSLNDFDTNLWVCLRFHIDLIKENKQNEVMVSSKCNFLAASLPHYFQFLQSSLIAISYEQSIEFMFEMWMSRFESSL